MATWRTYVGVCRVGGNLLVAFCGAHATAICGTIINKPRNREWARKTRAKREELKRGFPLLMRWRFSFHRDNLSQKYCWAAALYLKFSLIATSISSLIVSNPWTSNLMSNRRNDTNKYLSGINNTRQVVSILSTEALIVFFSPSIMQEIKAAHRADPNAINTTHGKHFSDEITNQNSDVICSVLRL